MGMRVLACVCLLLVASAFAGVLYQTGDVPTDETLTRIEVEDDGDAVFVLELRTVLETDEERASFEDFADDVENNPEASVSGFRASVESLVETARNQTGREMSVSNFTVETHTEPLPVERGVVEYSFEWKGFAEVETDGELRVGDVLSGYLLSEDDALVIRPPEGYEVSSAEPTPDSADGELRWNGPEGFADDEPRAVFTQASNESGGVGGARSGVSDTGNATTQNGVPSEGTGANANPSQGGGGGGFPLYVYGIAVVLVLSAVAIAYRALPESGKPTVPGESAGEKSGAASSEEEGRGEREEETEADEKVPDDERVLRMIETEGGSMKQKHLVEETGWSEAKVSKLTSSMEEEGEITKIRLGRENILEIKDEEEEEDEFGY